VVVDELDIISTSITPHEADPPLVVHTDAVLASAVPAQRLETVSRWDAEVIEGGR